MILSLQNDARLLQQQQQLQHQQQQLQLSGSSGFSRVTFNADHEDSFVLQSDSSLSLRPSQASESHEDIGLNALVASAPALRSLNLGQCSLLTSIGINNVVDSLGTVLRELYIDDCQNIDAMLILPALKKLEHLEVLSVADIQTVCDAFIHDFITVCGSNMKELVLANCGKLTDTSLKVIAESCSGLCALDLVNLHKLTDVAIGHLANGCQSIQALKLCRNAFSDESIAAFLEASGESLKELSLNNVKRDTNSLHEAVEKAVGRSEAHPYFYPVRNAESSRART